MPPSDHAYLSPSAAHRWFHCPAAPRLEAQYPSTSGPDAVRGQAAHLLAEEALRLFLREQRDLAAAAEWLEKQQDRVLRPDPKQNPVTVDAEMVEGVQLYVQEVAQRAGHDARVHLEQRLEMIKGCCSGTADCVVIDDENRKLSVIDLKFGYNAVPATNNPQLMLYAYGALIEIGSPEELETVDLVIVQPRLDGRISVHMLMVDDLLTWWHETAALAVKAAKRKNAKTRAGDWCKWCRHAHACSAMRDRVAQTAMTVFDPVDPTKQPAAAPPAAETLTPKQMGSVLSFADAIEAWIKTVRAHAVKLLGDGSASPDELGWKLVAGRATRKWSDEEQVAQCLRRAGIDPYHYTVLSPAQAEKAIKAHALAHEADAQAISICEIELDSYETISRGISLVPITDKRQAIQPAQAAFTIAAEEE